MLVAYGMDRSHYESDGPGEKAGGQVEVLIGLVTFVFTYALSIQAPIVQIISNIYPIHRAGTDSSIAYATGILMNFLIAEVFLDFLDDIWYGRVVIFVIFDFVTVIFFVFVLVVLPNISYKNTDENIKAIIGLKDEKYLEFVGEADFSEEQIAAKNVLYKKYSEAKGATVII